MPCVNMYEGLSRWFIIKNKHKKYQEQDMLLIIIYFTITGNRDKNYFDLLIPKIFYPLNIVENDSYIRI